MFIPQNMVSQAMVLPSRMDRKRLPSHSLHPGVHDSHAPEQRNKGRKILPAAGEIDPDN